MALASCDGISGTPTTSRNSGRNFSACPRASVAPSEERYCLALYLFALATHRKLKYPLRVEEGESPDFIIAWSSGKRTGLEVTKATNMWVQREMTHMEVEYERRESSARTFGVEPEPVSLMLSEHGWAGDQAEVEWLSFIKDAVARKVPKLADFRTTERQDLLAYDDTPLAAIERPKVFPILSRWLSETRKTNPLLGRVSIIVSLDLLLDSGDGLDVLPFVNWSDPKATPDFGERIEFVGEKAVTTAIRKTQARRPSDSLHRSEWAPGKRDARRHAVRSPRRA